MEPGVRPPRRVSEENLRAITEIVPARAVLTELARGFLLAQSADPRRAREFASTFLKEKAGRPGPGRIVPVNRRPTVRRRVAELPGEGSDAYGGLSGYVSDPPSDFGP